MSYVCSHARGESRNESPFAFAAALQLTWSHTSLGNDVSLPNWLVRRSCTAVFIFTVCTVNSCRAPSSPAGNEWNQLRSEIHVIAPVIVTVAQRVLTALILANKFLRRESSRALSERIILSGVAFAVEICARARDNSRSANRGGDDVN